MKIHINDIALADHIKIEKNLIQDILAEILVLKASAKLQQSLHTHTHTHTYIYIYIYIYIYVNFYWQTNKQ